MSENKEITREQKKAMLERDSRYRFTLEAEKRHEKIFAPLGISFSVYRTLAYLLLHEDGAAPSQIADDLFILRQNMTNILDTLEKKGLIERVAVPTDRRRLIVKLLPAGETLATDAVNEENRYGRLIHKYISDEELAEYHRLELKMNEAKVNALNDLLAERS